MVRIDIGGGMGAERLEKKMNDKTRAETNVLSDIPSTNDT